MPIIRSFLNAAIAISFLLLATYCGKKILAHEARVAEIESFDIVAKELMKGVK